jgi:GNAT superfamily N-acetyltransferase
MTGPQSIFEGTDSAKGFACNAYLHLWNAGAGRTNVVTFLLYDEKAAGKSAVNIALRTAGDDDVAFARNLYFETMRGIVERLFGWDQSREEKNFARFFKLDEVRIITADGQDVGWIQEQISERSINLGSFYVAPAMQGRGIGTQVLRMLLERAARESKAMTLAVVKINPARQFYEKRGFRTTHEDAYKFYMSASPM